MKLALFALTLLFTTAASHAQSPSPTPEGSDNSFGPVPVKVANNIVPGSTDIGANPRYVKKNEAAKIALSEAPPLIDGQLNDAVWQGATVFGDFIQTNPGDNVPPKHETEFMMAYDSKHLYMAFKIKQDRNNVRATVARRDNIFNDDYVLLYIDTFNDQRQAYVVSFNPLGIQADGTYTEGRGEDYSVDIVMNRREF